MGNTLSKLENGAWFDIEIKMSVDGSRPDRFRKIVRIKPGRSIRVKASTSKGLKIVRINTDDDPGGPECVMLLVYENGSWKGQYLLPQHLFAYAAVFCDRNQHGQVVLRAKRANFNLFRLKCFACLPAKYVGLGMVEEEI